MSEKIVSDFENGKSSPTKDDIGRFEKIKKISLGRFAGYVFTKTESKMPAVYAILINEKKSVFIYFLGGGSEKELSREHAIVFDEVLASLVLVD